MADLLERRWQLSIIYAALTGALTARAPSIEIAPPNLTRLPIPVQGMVCAACALLIEQRLRREPGVAQALVDFGAARAYLAFDPALTSAARLMPAQLWICRLRHPV